jgi:uncharacterized membrane protein
MSALYSLSLFLHLVGFAAYAGAAAASARFVRASRAPGMAGAVRDAFENTAAVLTTRVQLPAIFISVISGVSLLMQKQGLLSNPGMHMKLTVVAILLVLAHLEMFNTRRIVKARARGGDAAAEIDARKRRHGVMEFIDVAGIGVVLLLVAFKIRG